MDLFDLITEDRFGSQGSKSGRSTFASKEGTKHRKSKKSTQSAKSRVKVYDTIEDALKHGHMGQMFSTDGSSRLYVISHQKWGKDPEQKYAGRIAKGFTPGTIPSGFTDVKGYSKRTMQRHGKATAEKFKGEKYHHKNKR